MPVSVMLPDDLASQLRLYENDLQEILRLGIREWQARKEGEFSGLSSVLETLATLPAPDEVLALRPSEAVQARIDELLEKNRTSGLSTEERQEWERFQYVEHLVRMAKAQALLKLKGN
jgi:hypothetical protein